MTPERFDQIDSLLQAAQELPRENRRAFLDRACAGDGELLDEVASLLATWESAEGFIGHSPLEIPQTAGVPAAVATDEGDGGRVGSTAGRYRILAKIGQGGMGIVYKAEDPSLQRNVAIKFLPQETVANRQALKGFWREARAASALNHPNICAVYDIGDDPEAPFFVMELLEGESAAAQGRRGAMSTVQVAEFGIQVADALAAAHEKGIVHGDLSTANLFVLPGGRVKILDFGLARLLRPDASSSEASLTRSGLIAGTVAYMSPEQARGEKMDGRSDLFSLGIVLYQLAVGERPFEGVNDLMVLEAILNRPAAPPSSVNPAIDAELERILSKALEKDRSVRYQSASEMRADLEKLKTRLSLSPDSAPALPRLPTRRPDVWPVTAATTSGIRRLRQHPAWLVILAITLIAGGALAVYRLRSPVVKAPDALAVMPFRNTGDDPEVRYLAGALPQELNTQFQNVGSVTVRPYSSVQRYMNKDWDLADVSRDLKVGTLVTGSYLRRGDQLHISVEIVDAKENKTLWAAKFAGTQANVLDLLGQIAQRVTGVLRLRQNAKEFQHTTQSAEAYDLYLRSLAAAQETTEDNNTASIAALEKAVRIDERFARAHAALSEAYATRYWWNFSNDRSWLDKAETSARRALTIDPDLAEAHFALAHALEGKGERTAFLRENMASLRANPRYLPALLNVARYAFYMGDFDRALDVLSRIGDLDPTQNVEMRKAINLYFKGQSAAGHAENEKAEQRAQGVDELTLIGTTYVWLDDLPAAERVIDRLEHVQPEYSGTAEIRAWLATARRQTDKAREAMKRFAPRIETSWGIAQEASALYALQGDKENSIAALEKAVALGGPSYAWFKSDAFRILQGDPRYEAILKKLAGEYQPLHQEFSRLLDGQ